MTTLLEPSLSPDQELLVESTRRFLNDTRGSWEPRGTFSVDLDHQARWWREGAELGWTSMFAAKERGGGGVSQYPLLDACLLAYERGRQLAPGPFVGSAVAALLYTRAEDGQPQTDVLARENLAGISTVAVPLASMGLHRLYPGPDIEMRNAGGRSRLFGRQSGFMFSSTDTGVLFPVAEGEQTIWVFVDRGDSGILVEPGSSLDLQLEFGTATFEGAAAVPVARGDEVTRHASTLATVLLCSETVGLMAQMFDVTSTWLMERRSFGRPLASYQALKHRWADVRLLLDSSRAIVVAGARAWSDDPASAPRLASAAKSYISRNSLEMLQECVQLHGGIGVTWEHDLHVYLRRAVVNSQLLGEAEAHAKVLGGEVVAEASS